MNLSWPVLSSLNKDRLSPSTTCGGIILFFHHCSEGFGCPALEAMRWRGTGDCKEYTQALPKLLNLFRSRVLHSHIPILHIAKPQWTCSLRMRIPREASYLACNQAGRQDFRWPKRTAFISCMERKYGRARCRTKALILAIFTRPPPCLSFSHFRRSASGNSDSAPHCCLSLSKLLTRLKL